MKEELLHHIWRFQIFNKKSLTTNRGEVLRIVSPGMHNLNTGPDFLDATIKIGEETLYGHIEIHNREGDWYHHKHHLDPMYDNVILHVVWQHATNISPNSQTTLPTLTLASLADKTMLARYETLMQSQTVIPCRNHFTNGMQPMWKKMIRKALLKHFNDKHTFVQNLLKQNDNSDSTAYQVLVRAFGFHTNSEAFFRLSEKVPHRVIQKRWNDLPMLEALFFGQAGFLEDIKARGSHVALLQKNHKYLQKKYRLPPPMSKVTWKFFRLRPANFPTLRIAQLARFLYKQQHLFTFLLNTPHTKIASRLNRYPSLYWKHHYIFGKYTARTIPSMGTTSINNIIINAVIPLMVTYGKIRDEDFYIDRAINILQKLPAEKNTITKQWADIGFNIKNAFASQGSLELYKNFCTQKKCLSCDIGISLIQKKKTEP